ncbi:MAG TPA: CPBP family intramembrane glutamic endopeptidase [Candidatus Angelobacter sp.]|jgi:hypothetical protein
MIIVLLYLLVPVSRWPGATALLPRGSSQSAIVAFEIAYQWGAVVLVCAGLFANKLRFRDLIGKLWATGEEALRDISLGLLFWLLAIGLSLLTYLILGSSYNHLSRVLPRTLADLALFIPFALTAGFCEEVIFRGYLFKQFTWLTGSTDVALVIQAVIFSAAHGYDQTIAGVVNNFLFAIAFGVLANWRKSLLPSIIGHSWLDISVGIVGLIFP